MNPRITELWDKSAERDDIFTHARHEKFAELIIWECVNAAMDGTKEGDHYAQRIDNHFNDSPAGILYFKVEELIDFEKLIREDARCTTGDWVADEVIEYVRKYVRNVPNGDIKKQIESAFYETAHQ